MATVREFLTANITELIAALDDHEAGLYEDRAPASYYCRCGQFRGTQQEWEQHVAERMAAKFPAAQQEMVL